MEFNVLQVHLVFPPFPLSSLPLTPSNHLSSFYTEYTHILTPLEFTELVYAWKEHDPTGCGLIPVETFKDICRGMDYTMSKEIVETMFVEVDGDGGIDVDDEGILQPTLNQNPTLLRNPSLTLMLLNNIRYGLFRRMSLSPTHP